MTPTQAWYRSLTDEERQRYIDQSARRIRDYQQRTLDAGAERRYDPWTEGEDNLLVWSTKTTVDLAIQLGRTYNQCAERRTSLRRELTGFARQYVPVPMVSEPKQPVLCACASFDEEHESWCPNA